VTVPEVQAEGETGGQGYPQQAPHHRLGDLHAPRLAVEHAQIESEGEHYENIEGKQKP
jgi:hypothetical protein